MRYGMEMGDSGTGAPTPAQGAQPVQAIDPLDKNEIEELRKQVTRLQRELRMLRIANLELERVAIMDTLTPLHNRRHFISALNERIMRRQRYDSRCSVMFLDVNKLKYINDVYGHAAGDFALVHAAQVLARHIRNTDVAARIGGDEFAILLEESEGDAALRKAEQLEQSLRDSVCAYGDVILPISASVGLTSIEPDDSPDSIIERADADMYARKRQWYEKARESGIDSKGA